MIIDTFSESCRKYTLKNRLLNIGIAANCYICNDFIMFPMMKTKHELTQIMNFVADYATVQLGSGVHTSRVIRNTHRIGEALEVDINISTFQRSAVISLNDAADEEQLTRVVPIPALPISFRMNSDLSALSWDAVDGRLGLEEMRKRFEAAKSEQSLPTWIVTITVGLANASFCRLFGGDGVAMAIVFLATLVGFTIKNWLSARNVANYIVIAVASLVASAVASSSLLFPCNANIAIATSPLFLIPGVPLINGFIDIVEGYTLMGVSRLVNALILIICIAVGLSVTLIIVKNQLI